MLPVFTSTSTRESSGESPTSIVPVNSVNCPRTFDSMCRATNPTTVWVTSSSYLPTGGIDTPWYSRPSSAVCAISCVLTTPLLPEPASAPYTCARTYLTTKVGAYANSSRERCRGDLRPGRRGSHAGPPRVGGLGL